MKQLIFILIAAIVLVSCEKQIDIDIKDQEQKVVVKAQNDADSLIMVNLTYSRPVYGTFYVRNGEDYFPAINNATVTLTVDGAATETATRNGGNYTFTHIPQPGEQLALDIAIPGREAVTATTTVPLKPIVSEFDTVYITQDIDYFPAIFLTLNDRAATEDYYAIRMREIYTVIVINRDDNNNIISRDTSVEEHYRYFSCSDYLIVDGTGINVDIEDPTATNTFYGGELLFTDGKINGQSHRIRLDVGVRNNYDNYKDGDIITHSSIVVEVIALSRDLYLYRQTMNSYDDDVLLAFFSEPVQIHSNIKGGIGIFGVASKVTHRFYLR